MNLFRKAAAAALAVCTVLSCTGCGEKTANVMQVSGSDVRAGIYLYYATSAFGEAINVLRDGGEKFENATVSEDYKKILAKSDIDGVTAETWIQNKAAEHCETFMAIEKEFESLGLSLTGEQLAAADSSAASSMAYYGDFFKSEGIGEQSVKDIVLNSYKQQAVWEAYYGEGGKENIQEQELYDNYKDNHFRIKYIEMPLKDGEGNLLKADGKEEIEKMAKDYLNRLGKKKDEAEKMKEFDFLIEEHQNYVTSLSEAAVTTTDSDGKTITTPTTAKITTDKDGNTGTTTGEGTTAPAVTTTAPAADDDAAEPETDENGETVTSAEVTTTTTTTTTEATTTTTTTAEGVDYDTANERVLAVSTSAKDDEESKEETTTEPTYTPCEKVYNWAVDPKTEYLKPELIKDDECYYIVIKMDIEDRMTSNDLWSESAIEGVREDLYYDTFLEKLNGIAKDLPVTRNERAFNRYKVLNIDYIGYQNALMQAYSSMYGGVGG